MTPEFVIKTALFGGFDKKSAEDCLHQLTDSLNQLELQVGQPQTKFDVSMLKKAGFGTGYDKASVLTYIDMLQQKIITLEEELKK